MSEAERTSKDNEANAVELALHGRPRDRAKMAARALYDLLRNPDDTSRVFLLGILANRSNLPKFLARFVQEDRSNLLKDQPSIDSAHTDLKLLRGLGADTLGGAYLRYLDVNGLDPDLFQAPPGLPPVVSYLAKRLRQTHDIWHVLTDYAPDVSGEVALQAFTFAQTRMPSAGLIAFFGTLKWARSDRTLLRQVFEGYRRGKDASFLPTIRWEDHWHRSLKDLRSELGITPMTAPARRHAMPS